MADRTSHISDLAAEADQAHFAIRESGTNFPAYTRADRVFADALVRAYFEGHVLIDEGPSVPTMTQSDRRELARRLAEEGADK